MLKTEVVQVPAWEGSRDRGKLFKLTEMPAAKAEKWAYRLMLAYSRGGGEIPQNIAGQGMVGVAIVGINTFLRGNILFSDIEPLLDEMFECITFVYDAARQDLARALLEDDIADAQTRMWLRSEVIRLHVNFSIAEALWRLLSAIMTLED